MFAGIELLRHWLSPPSRTPLTCANALADAPQPLYFSLLPSILTAHVDRLVAINAWRNARFELHKQRFKLPDTETVVRRTALSSGEDIVAWGMRNTTILIEPGTPREQEVQVPGHLVSLITPERGADRTLVLTTRRTPSGSLLEVYSLSGALHGSHTITPRQRDSGRPATNVPVSVFGSWAQAGSTYLRLPLLSDPRPEPPGLRTVPFDVWAMVGTSEAPILVLVETVAINLLGFDLNTGAELFRILSEQTYIDEVSWLFWPESEVCAVHHSDVSPFTLHSLRDGSKLATCEGYPPSLRDVPPSSWRHDRSDNCLILLSVATQPPVAVCAPLSLITIYVVRSRTVAVCGPGWPTEAARHALRFDETIVLPVGVRALCCHSDTLFYATLTPQTVVVSAIDLVRAPHTPIRLCIVQSACKHVSFITSQEHTQHAPIVQLDDELYLFPRPSIPAALTDVR